MTWPFLLAPGLFAHQAVFRIAAATAISGVAMFIAGLQEIFEELGDIELIGPIEDLFDTYSGEYVGNMRSRELHEICCSWEKLMWPWNRRSFDTAEDALTAGYNGCAHCLPDYNTD